MILAMPSDGLWGDGSAYIPHPKQDFEKWIVDEVPTAVGSAVPQVTPRSPRSENFQSGCLEGVG